MYGIRNSHLLIFHSDKADSSFLYWKKMFNPLVPDAHYSERQDKPFSLQIQLLKVDLKLNCGILFFSPQELMDQDTGSKIIKK